MTHSGMQLEDLYVDPSYRGTGVGKALFAELGKVAEEKVKFLQSLKIV